MNELMAEFRGKDLPLKKKEYIAYTNEEWDDLAKEKNLSDKTLKNIVVEVEKDKPGLDWLEGRMPWPQRRGKRTQLRASTLRLSRSSPRL